MRNLIPLFSLIAIAVACDTHDTVTAPKSPYCPKVINVVVRSDTIMLTGVWTMPVVLLTTEQRLIWVHCSDGTPVE